ncbi:hypothetical protein A0O34_14490 [Chryseobacterium glaciei]|uniref:Secretion system C-terminal sorting domain-containing protein n=2 Tax=Chryseobacterium glaciei TaxID=1685010 RepID=A0A172XXC3_9FLAO|nr:hypothetical protein A0O34_14490 [Chryseobacterium glaciei]
MNAQSYTNTYNGVNYSSSRPYNLNVIYFVPNDIPLDPAYKTRLSAILLWGQNFYKQNMIQNGYGSKTFGLFTETINPNNVEINVIHGASPHTSYTYNNRTTMDTEIATYFANNPTLKTSDHTLVITAVTDQSTADAPFFGIGRNCYAIDYPQFNIQYLGTDNYSFTKWFGGMMHELGHGLNLPHSAQTKTEYNDPNKGITLMSFGNSTLGKSPTFINRAGCAVLNSCQVFADAPGVTYYNGNTAGLTGLQTAFNNGILTLYGTFQSNRQVTDVNIYQNPTQYPFPGNNSIAWSVTPSGGAFTVNMPVSELEFTNQNYYLVVQLVLQNGESTFEYYKYSYVNGVPNINIDFSTVYTCVGSSLQLNSNISGASYQWQFENSDGTWSNYPEGNVSGYATFTGSQTSTMTISNISSTYINAPNKARVAVKKADGTMAYTQGWVWKVRGITSQPATLTKTCVGSSLQLSAQASGASYQWQFQNADGSWSNYPEGNVPNYAIFSGTKTTTMTISNISNYYINNPNKARLLVYGENDCTTASNTAIWQAEGITAQPAALTTTCVGSSLQLTAQASGASYQWQYQNANGTWGNYPEGNVPSYATFSGTKTPTMTISNVSANYINGNQARLLVTGSNGCTTTSNTVTWNSKNCAARSGKDDMSDIKNITNSMNDQTVYPNPVEDELTVNLGSVKDNYQVEISNSVGQTIYKTTTSDQTLKVFLSDKPAGIYIVNIKGVKTGSNKSIKIIKK